MTADGSTVVFVHGLYMRGLEMSLLRRRVARAGFVVQQFHYPSWSASVQQNAEKLITYLDGLDSPRLQLVGHSLGGLVIVRAMELKKNLPVDRIVLLASPVNGSGLARYMMTRRSLRWMLGKSAVDGLAVSRQVVWRGAAALATLAGTRGLGPATLISHLARPNDGTVSLAETRIEGATDHAELPVSHMGILVSRTAARLVVSFLRDGKFFVLNTG